MEPVGTEWRAGRDAADSFNLMRIDGSTRIVGVFGWPVTHTASPAMHNAAFAALEMNWVYLAFAVEPQNLRVALHGARDMGLAGVNLTVPHKVLALEIVEQTDPEARRLGAVNTIVFERGRLRGFNTDGYGITQAVREDFGMDLAGRRVLVLGAGGAGRAIAVQCALAGAKKLWVANRTPARVEPLARALAGTGAAFEALPLDPAAIERIAPELDLLINATSVGLRPGESLGLPDRVFSPRLAVCDTIYRPAETGLLRQARRAGARAANGLSMLLHQGVRAFEIWTGRTPPLEVMRAALQQAAGGAES
jgi:shikimate dehydrogenase